MTTRQHTIRTLLITVATGAVITACADQAPLDPTAEVALEENFVQGGDAETNRALATMRRVTARYHDIDAAFADGFVLLHPCEERPHHGPVGAVYVHFDRLMDGVIDPASPDALIYEPGTDGRDRLVGVEFALPYSLWNEPQPPEYLGHAFQPENEFGVWALHAWTWRHNPEGMFAESNPNVSCGS